MWVVGIYFSLPPCLFLSSCSLVFLSSSCLPVFPPPRPPAIQSRRTLLASGCSRSSVDSGSPSLQGRVIIIIILLLLPPLHPSLLLLIRPPPPTSSLLQWRPMEANGIQWSPTDSNGTPRPYEANPACSGGACRIRFMGGGRGPMKRILHARGEHAGFASWGEAAAP